MVSLPERITIMQHLLEQMLSTAQTYAVSCDPLTPKIAASAAVASMLGAVTELLPQELHAPVQALLDLHDTLWNLREEGS
jgi:hypothetical protein